jgi:hypothetical protein
MTLETIAPLSDDPIVSLPAVAAPASLPESMTAPPLLHHVRGHDPKNRTATLPTRLGVGSTRRSKSKWECAHRRDAPTCASGFRRRIDRRDGPRLITEPSRLGYSAAVEHRPRGMPEKGKIKAAQYTSPVGADQRSTAGPGGQRLGRRGAFPRGPRLSE